MKRVWGSFNGFSCAPPCLSLSTCSASQWPERRKNRRERADVSACSVHWLQFWLLYPSPFLNSASDGTVEELVRKVNSSFKNGLQTASEGWNTFIFCFSPFSCWIHHTFLFLSPLFNKKYLWKHYNNPQRAPSNWPSVVHCWGFVGHTFIAWSWFSLTSLISAVTRSNSRATFRKQALISLLYVGHQAPTQSANNW